MTGPPAGRGLVVIGARQIPGEGEARQHADHRRRRHGEQDAEEAEQGAAGEQRENHPDRVQSHPIADQLGRQDVGLDRLAHQEQAGDPEDRQPVGELNEGERDAGGKAHQAADEGDEGERADHQPDGEPEIEAEQAESDAVIDGQDDADQGLAVDEPGQVAVDQPDLLAHDLGLAARQPAVDAVDQTVPVAQQIEGHDRRDEDERQDVGERQPAAQEVGQRARYPAENVAGLGAHLVAQLAQIEVEAGLHHGDERIDAAAQHLDIGRRALHEGHDLLLQQRLQQHDGDNQDRRGDDGDDAGGERPRGAAALQPVAAGVE